LRCDQDLKLSMKNLVVNNCRDIRLLRQSFGAIIVLRNTRSGENRFRTFLKTHFKISIFIDVGFVRFLKLQIAVSKNFTDAYWANVATPRLLLQRSASRRSRLFLKVSPC